MSRDARRADRVSARVLVLDAAGRVLVMRRCRPGGTPYLTTIGGGVEPGETASDAGARECLEEAGATVEIGPELGRDLFEHDGHVTEHVFLAGRLVSQDLALRHGPELADPSQGSYQPVWLWRDDPEFATLRPALARELLHRLVPRLVRGSGSAGR